MNINTTTLSTEAKQALRTFGVAAARYHAAKKQKVKLHFRYTTHVQEVYVPRSIETDYFDSKIALRSYPELKTLVDQIDAGTLLDQVEGQGADAQAQAYAEMVAIEKSISSTL